jgi:hypothetical protein
MVFVGMVLLIVVNNVMMVIMSMEMDALLVVDYNFVGIVLLIIMEHNNVMMVIVPIMMVVQIVLKTVVMELGKNLQNNVMMEIPLMEMAVPLLV